jgi:hypothetical protein
MSRLPTVGLLWLLLAGQAWAERVTLVVTGLPKGTPRDAVLSIGANVNGWNPAAPGFTFDRGEARTPRLVIDVPAGTLLEYKVTRGSWETVEKAADGSDRANRRLDVVCEATVEIVVARWADADPATSTARAFTDRVER